MLAEGITKGNHQREYIIGTLCQSSGGPIAFASVAYYYYFLLLLLFFFFSFFPERLLSENIDEKRS